MAILRYAVLQVGREWRVVCARRRIGHFTTRAQAVEAGARLAREAVLTGHQVEFMVQDRTGLLLAQNFQPRLAAEPPASVRQGWTPQPTAGQEGIATRA